MASIKLVDIAKRYPGGGNSVRDLNLTVNEGELFTLLGPSGCGKSTTLRMIAGFVAPTEGRILLDGQDVTLLPPERRGTGMVFQNYALFPHMSVAANVAYGLDIRKVPTAEKAARVATALRQVGLSGYGERRIDQLSGGQQQRVALARALVIQPSVLLLDEPLSNLDATLREETRREIRDTQQAAGITCVYVTHDQAEALAMSDRVGVLEAGRLHQVASPREVYNRPATAFVARFLGRANVVPCTVTGLEADRVRIELADGTSLMAPRVEGTASSRLAVGDRSALSMRPESIALRRAAPAAPLPMSGRVLTAEFNGSTIVYAVEWLDIVLTVVAPDGPGAVHPGDPVTLRPVPERLWLVEP